MPQDHFSVLGLSPGRYPPSVITDRYQQLCAATDDKQRRERGLVAYWTLKDPAKQWQYLRRHLGARRTEPIKDSESHERSDHRALRYLLTRRIHERMDGPLLRWSARQALLKEAEALGLSRFLAMLTIAETIHNLRTTGPIEGTGPSHPPSPVRRCKNNRRVRFWLTATIMIGSVEALLLWWLVVG